MGWEGSWMKTIIVALGGNALLRPHQIGTIDEQREPAQTSARQIRQLIEMGYRVVITHGNGPQVGNILLQNELAKNRTPPMPLDVCGSESQGMIGYLIQQSLHNELRASGIDLPVVTLLTQVIVDKNDPAFQAPSKPVGPFCSREEAEKAVREKGETWMEDSGRGWRKAVPCPYPREFAEVGTIAGLIEQGTVLIAGGGGGIPVIRENDGSLRGVEAVVDKDLAASLLAKSIKSDMLAILTDVSQVALNYGRPNQQNLSRLTVGDARAYLEQGYFGKGSMEPKIRAAVEFVLAGEGQALITSLDNLVEGVKGLQGTRIVPDEQT